MVSSEISFEPKHWYTILVGAEPADKERHMPDMRIAGARGELTWQLAR